MKWKKFDFGTPKKCEECNKEIWSGRICNHCARLRKEISAAGGPLAYLEKTKTEPKKKTKKRLNPLLAAKWFNKHNPQFNLPEKNILGRSRRKTQP